MTEPIIRPLSGIRVIGLEQYMSGPYCTMLLADVGAEHVGYGTKTEHYGVARDCLIHAIRQHAGDSWSEQLERDWREAIDAELVGLRLGPRRHARRDGADAASVAR